MRTECEAIRQALQAILPDREFDLEPNTRSSSPLFLLLTTNRHIVGFAALDGKPDLNYAEAFEEFRGLYSRHAGEWADLDLTLILCKEKTEELDDEFRNRVEVDAYFCRKFVIDLGDDLEYELKRLPFVPVLLEVEHEVKMPISAQTFLVKHGVDSDLARYLVVPHAMGVEMITHKCLSDAFGKLDWLGDDVAELTSPRERKGEPIRLKELRISNFRAYRRSHTFDLDADIVVFYGPNGFGKTSLFDAIDFACTGGVARLDERFGRKTDRLLNALRHLDSSIEDAFVGITTSENGSESSLERYVQNRTVAYINGGTRDRTRTLMLLAGLEEKPADVRIENLVRLFQSSHLFGQEYQSLTSAFRDKSVLDESIVSRMLALQDYVESIHKGRRVLDEFRKIGDDKEMEVSTLKDYISVRRKEVNQLRKSRARLKDADAVLALGKEIAERVLNEMGSRVTVPTMIGKETVHDWRTLVSAKIVSTTQELQMIAELEAALPNLSHKRKSLSQTTAQLSHMQDSRKRIDGDLLNSRSIFQSIAEALERLLQEERSLSSMRDSLQWLLEAKPEYNKAKGRLAKEDGKQLHIQSRLLEVVPEIERANAEDEALNRSIEEYKEQSKELQNRLEGIRQLRNDLDNWAQGVVQREDMTRSLQETEMRVEQAVKELEEKKRELDRAATTAEQLDRHLAELEESRSELQVLLDRIEGHIIGEVCPVCGAKHSSREELIRQLELQRGTQPREIAEALGLAQDAKARAKELDREVRKLESECARLATDCDSIQGNLNRVNERISSYVERASVLGIPTTVGDATHVIDAAEHTVSEEVDLGQKKLAEVQSGWDKLQESRTALLAQQESLLQDAQVSESTQSRLRSVVDRISGEASDRQVSLESDVSTTQQELTTTVHRIEALLPQIEAQQAEKREAEDATADLSKQKETLENEIQELSRRVADARESIDRMESIARQLNVDSDIDSHHLLLMKRNCQERLRALNTLQNDILSFEVALDSAETGAMVARDLAQIDNMAGRIAEFEQERSALQNCRRYFTSLVEGLKSQQDQALDEYTKKYGPLTSSIQRRLRSVYGFGDIRLQPERGGIAVRVERKKRQDLSPSDYFSESQIQIAMLCLFLSATLTQTWSSFAPVLLDDPVEHFDDLNSYSLVDLIRGLVTDTDRCRQFIISTCDERLFRLIRQRFGTIPEKSLFYVFESIGEDGPRVRCLSRE